MKNVKRSIKSITLSSIISLSMAVPVLAAPSTNQNVIVGIEQYSEGTVWKPGDSRSLKFYIKNNLNKKIKVDTISMFNKSREDINLGLALEEMAKHTKIDFKYNDKSVVKEVLTLDKFLKEEKVILSNQVPISSKQEVELIMEINMDEEMGNAAQSLSSVYNFNIGYKIIDNSGGGGSGGSGSEDTEPEEPEKPEDPENPGGSEDTDEPENPENPENPDEPENPGGSEDTDKPETPNKPGDTNKPGGSDGTNKPGTGGNGNNVGGSTNKLPQTGGIVNSSTLTIVGISVAGVGIVLDRKSSSKKGGKIDE